MKDDEGLPYEKFEDEDEKRRMSKLARAYVEEVKSMEEEEDEQYSELDAEMATLDSRTDDITRVAIALFTSGRFTDDAAIAAAIAFSDKLYEALEKEVNRLSAEYESNQKKRNKNDNKQRR